MRGSAIHSAVHSTVEIPKCLNMFRSSECLYFVELPDENHCRYAFFVKDLHDLCGKWFCTHGEVWRDLRINGDQW
jgi:hypothetical protein